ncbi:MAG: hypothetical protein ABIP28_00820 [Mucilaginibacter sp.]
MKFYLLSIPLAFILFSSCQKNNLNPVEFKAAEYNDKAKKASYANTGTSALIIDKSPDLIKIYMRTGRNGNRWILLNYKHDVLLDMPDDYNPPPGTKPPAQGYNIWHFRQAAEAYRTGEYTFDTDNTLLCQNGEWEFAVLNNSSKDYSGGSLHGWEVKNSFSLRVDNVYPRENSPFKKECDQITIVQNSDVYMPNTVDLLANITKNYTIKRDSIILKIDVRWARNIGLSSLKFGMLPASRKSNGKQVTKFGTRTVNGVVSAVVDITQPFFKPANILSSFNPNTSKIKIWGDDFVASVERVQNPALSTSGMTVSESSSYNKIYPDFTGVTSVVTGQKYTMTARYYLGFKK